MVGRKEASTDGSHKLVTLSVIAISLMILGRGKSRWGGHFGPRAHKQWGPTRACASGSSLRSPCDLGQDPVEGDTPLLAENLSTSLYGRKCSIAVETNWFQKHQYLWQFQCYQTYLHVLFQVSIVYLIFFYSLVTCVLVYVHLGSSTKPLVSFWASFLFGG